MLQTIAIVIIILLAMILLYAATRPNTFRVQRTTSIKAPPEKVFALLNDFKAWGGWSPWENIDPALKRTFSGTASGKGTQYAWEGNNKVGHGSMEIIESSPPSRLLIKLDFLKPFEAHNTTEFTLTPSDGYTEVTWAMYGPNLFMGKVMSLFCNMDKMVGGSFETGLANLKAHSEK